MLSEKGKWKWSEEDQKLIQIVEEIKPTVEPKPDPKVYTGQYL